MHIHLNPHSSSRVGGVITAAAMALAGSMAAPAPAPAAASALAQAPAPDTALRITWVPNRPVQGSIAYIVVDPAGNASDSLDVSEPLRIEGSLAGEALHFDQIDGRRFRALAAIPVDADSGVDLTLVIVRSDSVADSLSQILPVASGSYSMERLTVAPKYGGKPDPVLAKRIASEYAKAAAVSRRAHETPRLWSGEFILPRDTHITSEFGSGREFNGAVQSRHMGTDLAGAKGAPVRAANRGVVSLIGDFYYAGNAVYVDHGGGLITAYFHLSDVAVAEGDTVERGDVIGQVGATGRVTGPHLHWVLRYGSVSVDPMSVFMLPRFPTDEARLSTAPPSPAEQRADSLGVAAPSSPGPAPTAIPPG